MKSRMEQFVALLGVSSVLMGGFLHAEQTPALEPKLPPAQQSGQPVLIEESPAEKRSATEARVIATVNGIVISPARPLLSEEEIKSVRGVQVKDVVFLEGSDFKNLIESYLGKSAGLSDLKRLQKDIIRFCQINRDMLLVDVWYPEQKIEQGVIQIFVAEGKVREVTVVNEGRKFFSDRLVRQKFTLKEGENIDRSELNEDLDWAAQNSFFRDINVALKAPGEEYLGTSDVELRVRDRFPLRGFIGYEDSGTSVVGEDRFLAGFNYGNVFGLDHQLNYQYMADTDFRFLHAHSASYVAPLPWRHTLTFLGSYADIEADIAAFGFKGLTLRGTYSQVGMRYRVGLPKLGRLQHGVSVGLDYKRTDNNLLFDTTPVLHAPIEVAQGLIEYDLTMQDRFGATSLDGQIYFSAGGFSSENRDSNFNTSRLGAKAGYFYTRLQATRQTPIYNGWSWVLKGTGQYTPDRLVPTEQIGAGGYNTVRGYDERVANGDQGFVISNEIYTPPISFGLGRAFGLKEDFGFSTRGNQSDKLQFLGFFDFGYTRSVNFIRNYDPDDATLSSVGAGVRFKFRNNLSLRVDYAVQLSDRFGAERSRVHLGAVASF